MSLQLIACGMSGQNKQLDKYSSIFRLNQARDTALDTLNNPISYLISFILFFTPSLWIRLKPKNRKFKNIKQYTALIYNFIIIMTHGHFISSGHFPVLGENNDPWLKSVSIFMLMAHIFSMPFVARGNHQFSENPPYLLNPCDHKHSVDLIPEKGDFIYFIKSCIIIFSCACTATVIISFMILNPLDLDQKTNKTIIIAIFIAILTTLIYLHIDNYKKNGPNL